VPVDRDRYEEFLALQTTLLGIGIAIILALIAALVGPHVVDWRSHRAMFEREASRLVGAQTRIDGAIDVRLLPVPSVTFRDVKIAGVTPEAGLSAREVSVEFALGPLVRGEWRATDMRLVAPEIHAGVDAKGHFAWAVNVPSADADTFSIDQLSIQDGTVILADAASKTREKLERFSFSGDIRSLAGPVRGDGGFVIRGERYAYRLSLGRKDDDGATRVRLNLNPADRPVSSEIEGALTLAKGIPAFAGTFTRTRTPDVKLAAGQVVANEPWRLTARVQATPAQASFDQVELLYGTEPRALKFAGTGKFAFGAYPRLDAALTARQADFDRLVSLPAGTRRLPLVVVGTLVKPFDGAPPAFPVKVDLRAEAATLGGGAIRNLRGTLVGDAAGWSLQTLDLKGPGGTVVHAGGALRTVQKTVSFTGPATIEASDSNALAAWLEGRADTGAARMGPFRAQGDVTIGSNRFVVDHLNVDFDRKAISGRLAYGATEPKRAPKLDLDLKAAALDIDGTIALLRTALPTLSLEMPAEVSLNADLGSATYAGISARDVKAKLSLDAGNLVVERVAIGDLSGATVGVTGKVQGPWSKPKGALTLDLSGQDLHGVADLVASVWPDSGGMARLVIPRFAPAKLRATLNLNSSETAQGHGTTQLRIAGTAGDVAVNADAAVQGDILDAKTWSTKVNSKFDARDGAALLRFVGLDRAFAVKTGNANLRLTANGKLAELRIDGKLAAPGFDGDVRGTAGLLGDGGPHGSGTVGITAADAASLRGIAGDADAALPASVKAKVSASRQRISFDDISGRLGKSAIGGRLAFALDTDRIDGRIDADAINASALMAALAGMPSPNANAPLVWSTDSFTPHALTAWSGGVTLTAAHARLSPKLEVSQLKTVLKLDGPDVSFDDIGGVIGGGQLSGQTALQRTEAGLTMTAALSLAGADLATMTREGERTPLSGKLDLQFDVKGVGRSPAALAGSLTGSGTLKINGAAASGLDPQAFDIVGKTADQGDTVDANKLKTTVDAALYRERMPLGRVDAAFTVSAGQLRLADVSAHNDRADVKLNATVDLVRRMLDARLTLTGLPQKGAPSAGRPEIYVALNGPVDAPNRSVDVSALLGWLTLRSVDVQAKRLDAAEEQRRATEEAVRRAEEAAKQRAARAAAEAEAKREAAKREEEAKREAAKRDADQRAREAALSNDQPNIMREEAAPEVKPSSPISGPVPIPPVRPRSPSASAPSAVEPQATETAPALPPPVDVKPAPAPRRTNARRSEHPRSSNTPPPPRAPRNVFERLFGLGR
jgi:large subunit ribosomal protein L24